MTACDDCLRRTDLIAAIAGRLEIEFKQRTAPGARARARRRRVARGRAPDADVARRYRAVRRAGGAGAGLARRARDGVPLPRRVPGSGCSTSRTRRRCSTSSAIRVCSRSRTASRSSARGARRRTGSTWRARSAAACRRRGSRSCPGSRSGSTRRRTRARSKRPAGPSACWRRAPHVPYPARGWRLHAAVAARGAVISEMPPGASAYKWCFIARNRIIAALGAATVVVQATERSGSLTTADFAAELGRAVGAVPGQVTSRLSAGTHALIQAGAPLIRDAADALELLAGATGRVFDDRRRRAAARARAAARRACSTRSRTATARSASSPRRPKRPAPRSPASASSSASAWSGAASPAAGSGRRESGGVADATPSSARSRARSR